MQRDCAIPGQKVPAFSGQEEGFKLEEVIMQVFVTLFHLTTKLG